MIEKMEEKPFNIFLRFFPLPDDLIHAKEGEAAEQKINEKEAC